MRRLPLALGVCLLLAACSASTQTADTTSEPANTTYAYSLVAPLEVSTSGLVARAVMPQGSKCPTLEVTGAASVPMQQRLPGKTTNGAFDDVVVCSAPMPAGATGASINGIAIPPAMPEQVTSIAALADTGCMIFKSTVQNCNSPTDWPFAALAGKIAEARPSLIIHDGDYFYRENPCPASDADKCGDSPAPPKGVPFLDSGAGWLADFFEPAKAMLTAAPLMAMRGNHEICSVAGNGYFLFLDTGANTSQECAPVQRGSKTVAPTVVTKPWKVDVKSVGGQSLRLITVDSAYGWTYGQSQWWRRLRPDYALAHKWAGDKGVEPWLITHQPSLALTSVKERPKGIPDWLPWVSGDQMAASYGLLNRYSAIISGHLHLSEVVKVPGQPTQFVVGGGGTYLDRPEGYETPKYGPLANSKGEPVLAGKKPYPPASYRWTEIKHAFTLGTPDPSQGSWNIKYVGADGSTLGDCQIRAQGNPQC